MDECERQLVDAVIAYLRRYANALQNVLLQWEERDQWKNSKRKSVYVSLPSIGKPSDQH